VLGETAAAIEAMPLSAFVRSSVWAYPALNIAHIIGLLLAIGGVWLLDLRVLGAGGGRLPWRDISAALSPAIMAGPELLTRALPADDVDAGLNGLMSAALWASRRSPSGWRPTQFGARCRAWASAMHKATASSGRGWSSPG